MSDLEVRQLRYFMAVADELHFGRAAERLAMAQPPLSRAIRELERQLGVQLFERTTRQVALTPAGHVLQREAHIVLDAATAAAERTRHAGRETATLRVALKADYDAGLLPEILTAYEEDESSQPVEVLLGGRGDQVIALREGRADVALLPAPVVGQDLDVEPLLTEPRVVALAATDPLAARHELSLADLAGRLLPDGTRADHEGTPPEASTPVPAVLSGGGLDLAQIFSLVEIGTIVWFPPLSLARRHARAHIAYRRVVDVPPSTLVVAWPQASRSTAVAAFVRAAVAVCAAAQTAPTDAVREALPLS